MHKQHHPPSAFAQLGIQQPLLSALDRIAFKDPTEIQNQLIPLILEGKDVLGQARTGTGKTAAFGLPVLQMIRLEGRLQALVLVPTRELAVQVAAELQRMCGNEDLHVVPIYGGQRIRHQTHLLGRRPHVVVGTPGRVIDMLDRRFLDFSDIRFAVLDEVDRMLDIGFRDDIRNILGRVTGTHQTVIVSATITEEIKRLGFRYMKDPVEINVSQDDLTVEQVHQSFVTVEAWDKYRALELLLADDVVQSAIIFCNTKHHARRLTRRLHGAGVDAMEIHGDLEQSKREKVMERFRKHKVRLLVATDLASRGIDVQGISHIINFDMPDDAHSYVHRIGRTARMGNLGRAISFVTREQGKQLTEIEILINKQIEQQLIPGFEPSPEPAERFERRTGFAPPAPAADRPGPMSAPVAPAEPAKPQRLGAKFKPMRRRRR